MQFNQTIKRVISALLICIFALSITPVLVVHSLFANHKDKSFNMSLTGSQFSESGFNCNVENFVAEGQFLNDCSSFEFSIPIIHTVFNGAYGYTFFTQHHFFSELRGPPARV